MGVTRAGGNNGGAGLALLGSIVGGLLGVIIGLPIPLLGPLVAALLFGGRGP